MALDARDETVDREVTHRQVRVGRSGRIRPDEIDYARARNAAKRDHSLDLQRVVDLMRNQNLLGFAGGLQKMAGARRIVGRPS